MYGNGPYNSAERETGMFQDEQKKTSRLEARITPSVYALLLRAATLQGRSISDFVIGAAQQAAEETIAHREVVDLSQVDQARFAAALLHDTPLAPAMDRAAAAHRRLIQRS